MDFDEIFECTFLSTHQGSVDADELSRLSGLSASELEELVEFGALTPIESRSRARIFSNDAVTLARTAGRLRAHFDLNMSGVALALIYLQRMRELEGKIIELECHLVRR
jgi:chaperone modulatory protein CbpM